MTHAEFASDIANHQMTIIRDDGLYRHIRYQRPGTGIMHFDLITWPGYLAYAGDMGSFVFTRLPDMFEFFRTGPGINPGYWSQKLVAIDRDGVKKYSPELFRENIRDWLSAIDNGDDADLIEAVEEYVLRYADEGQDTAIGEAMCFEHNGRRIFQDFHEVDCTEWTHRFLWCCHALRWGIGMYDTKAAEGVK